MKQVRNAEFGQIDCRNYFTKNSAPKRNVKVISQYSRHQKSSLVLLRIRRSKGLAHANCGERVNLLIGAAIVSTQYVLTHLIIKK